MEWEKFRALADQYEAATRDLIAVSRRALAGDMAACADPTLLERANDAHTQFVSVAAEAFSEAVTGQPGSSDSPPSRP